MPIYEYECSCCSSRFELKQSFSDDSLAFCPQCGSEAQRIFSPAAIIFKGPGFYATDSRGNHDRASSEGEAGEARAGEAKAGEAKPDEAKPGSIDKDS